MNSPLILAAVTAVLRNLLENGLAAEGITTALGSDASVSAQPPDRVASGPEDKARINLFLYQVRARGLSPSSRHAPAGRGPETPRGLEMQYLLTAYGVDDLQAEILLGYGLALLGASPILTAPEIRRILGAVSSQSGGRLVAPAPAALADARLPDMLRRIKVSPQALDTEEMVNLWSSFQVSYRPSVAYHVAVELAEEAEDS